MKVFYYIFVAIYTSSVRIASYFNPKARKWIDGRKNLLSKIKESGISDDQIIWVHCASLGEFEQGRPIIEKLKINYPDHKILITFFSPSGYEVRKNYEHADYIFYLPSDTKRNARKFIKYVRPKLVIFIKYEFWFNYIHELYKQKIPLIFASVIFRRSQHFFKPWGGWAVKQLVKITYLFVQNDESIELLDKIGIYHAEVSGDTRFDRVAELPEYNVHFPVINNFKGNSKLLIGGSTWPRCEDILFDALNDSKEEFKLVIAPHEISKEHISNILKKFTFFNPILYSRASDSETLNSKVLIIDSIGALSMIYRYADIAYVGGGFGVGIHNLLEVSTYGIPVIFGPNYHRFKEAIDLKDVGAGFSMETTNEFISIIDKLLSNSEFYSSSSAAAKKYIDVNVGATQVVINKVKEYIIAD
jgi:3-deoxy-D-manno-octulosonic-acid transferase